jgi:hypothetical protein
MRSIHKQKMAAEIEGEFVLIVLGMRINKPWKIHKWLPVALTMLKLLKELAAHPETGYLGHIWCGFLTIVYWRSFDQIEAYARSKDYAHLPIWAWFQKTQGYTSGDVGIWHELYAVTPGTYEAVYTAMPATGLGSIGQLRPATGHRDTSRGRLQSNAPVEPHRVLR